MKNNKKKIAFLSTYPPRECGLATFTQDLVTAIDGSGEIDTKVIAVTNPGNDVYDSKVIAMIAQNEQADYIRMAKELNHSDIDLLVIEHEYGIFGGEHGAYILDLINNLEIPVVTTFHTILSKPDPQQQSIINALGKKSEKVITMARNTKPLLKSIYGIDQEKIEVIHHGVPKRPFQTRESLKTKYGYENRQIISTFGLIGPSKGIEYGIEAIAKVVMDHKDVRYLILGQTHPALKEEGIAYRNKMEALVENLDLSNNVEFINKYLSKDEIIDYLQLSDIYMTPYLGKDQAVSGTMAYAVGYGKAIVSTPYLYAKEMLSGGRGFLSEFSNPDSLAENIKNIIKNPDIKARMERDTIKLGGTMYWDKIAQCYLEVFFDIIKSSPKTEVAS
ncbi:MAG: glycosyltransferase family 4 protein [Eubacteriales bacterium]|nr:glycosyltransferase family 4 protein [Eubacteriales bacterium]MDD3199991.1 glycosyltransferase family 4 protein [Eubacteriales bacterium]MDD4122438.1 glycosyltransferase family 4 protein [Eubacteriales bacterium]MDD4629986.1 glycosyltransferase family 4 protein [Eubacteriales bacterium]